MSPSKNKRLKKGLWKIKAPGLSFWILRYINWIDDNLEYAEL